MTPKEYLNKWIEGGGKVSPLNKQKLSQLPLHLSAIAYLEVGLPQYAAPYINFVNASDDLFEGIAKLEDQYNLEIESNKYIVIGADGSGNPIAINVKNNDMIEWLDHEDYFEPSYVNNSIESLLTFLIIYRDFLNETIISHGGKSLISDDFTDEQYNILKQRMSAIDSPALTEAGFWKEELEVLLKNREYYRSKI